MPAISREILNAIGNKMPTTAVELMKAHLDQSQRVAVEGKNIAIDGIRRIMNTKLIFFGYGGYKIITPDNKHIVIDPFLTGNPVAPFTPESLGQVDLLLITHNAYDHFGDAPEILKRYNCPVICAKDVSHRLTEIFKVDPDLIRVTIWGMAMKCVRNHGATDGKRSLVVWHYAG